MKRQITAKSRIEDIPPLPSKDDPEFANLPSETRRAIRVWHARLSEVWKARPISTAWTRLAKKRGFSRKQLIKLYYKLRRSNSWKGLIDLRRVQPNARTLRVPFAAHGFNLSIISVGQEQVVIHVSPITPQKGGPRRG